MRTPDEIMEGLAANIEDAKTQELIANLELGVIREVLLDIRDLLAKRAEEEV